MTILVELSALEVFGRHGLLPEERVGQNFLYDVRVDPGEQHDVAQSHIALWQELRGLADKWEADVDAEARQR